MRSEPRIPFIGRNNELNRLLSAWASVSSGSGPKLIALIGDSGLGKTRLVNEFYQRIASAQEYWPKAISSDPLDLNPQFDSHVPKGQIPWLWWAMRSHNPEGRNCVQDDGCAITRSAPLLKRHTDAAIIARLGEKKLDELKTMTIDAGWNLAQALPGIGNLAAMGVAVKSLVEIGKIYSANKKILSAPALTPAESQAAGRREVAEDCIAFLEMFLNPYEKKLPTIPVVITLDDAQWLDSTTLHTVYRLLNIAIGKGWPLLIISTHWETEWKNWNGQLPDDPEDFRDWTHFRQIGTTLRKFRPDLQATCLEDVLISKMDCEPLFDYAFPNIGAAARKHCMDFSDGNAFIMQQLISLIADAPSWWFEKQNPDGPLSQKGLQALQKDSGPADNLKTLYRNRLKQAREIDETMHRFLHFASVQGTRFFAELIEESTDKGAKQKTLELLEKAEKSHNLIWVEPAPVTAAEFKHRLLSDLLKDEIDPDELSELKTRLTITLCEWLEESRVEIAPENESFFNFAAEWIKSLPSAGGDVQVSDAAARLSEALAILQAQQPNPALTAVYGKLRFELISAALKDHKEALVSAAKNYGECLVGVAKAAQAVELLRHIIEEEPDNNELKLALCDALVALSEENGETHWLNGNYVRSTLLKEAVNISKQIYELQNKTEGFSNRLTIDSGLTYVGVSFRCDADLAERQLLPDRFPFLVHLALSDHKNDSALCDKALLAFGSSFNVGQTALWNWTRLDGDAPDAYGPYTTGGGTSAYHEWAGISGGDSHVQWAMDLHKRLPDPIAIFLELFEMRKARFGESSEKALECIFMATSAMEDCGQWTPKVEMLEKFEAAPEFQSLSIKLKHKVYLEHGRVLTLYGKRPDFVEYYNRGVKLLKDWRAELQKSLGELHPFVVEISHFLDERGDDELK